MQWDIWMISFSIFVLNIGLYVLIGYIVEIKKIFKKNFNNIQGKE
jgi:hypothetical protein